MLCVIVKDLYYFDKSRKHLIIEKMLEANPNFKNLEDFNFEYCVEPQDIIDLCKRMDENLWKTICVTLFDPSEHPQISSFCQGLRISNSCGVRTQAQYLMGKTETEVFKEILNTDIMESRQTLDHYTTDVNSVDFQRILNSLKNIKLRKRFGIAIRGYFLAGVPGTGKTYLAKCVAGTLNRPLILLNLSYFINHHDTFGMLFAFFDFFKNTKGEFVILIDEIEKMFTDSEKAQQVLGYLLTTLNEFGAGTGNIKSDVFFIATANNIVKLSKSNPELFRKGRFDEAIYLTSPNEIKARGTWAIYENIYRKTFEKEGFPALVSIYTEFSKKINIENTEPNEALDIIIKGMEEEKMFIQKNSRAGQIFTELHNNADFRNSVKLFNGLTNNVKLTDDYIMKELCENKIVEAFFNEIKEKYAFKVNVDNAVSVCFSTYRQKMTTDMNLFPYVPAEIESIVREFYQSYYMFDLNFDLQKDANLKQYISSNTPLQISMSAGIKEMDGATKSFAKL